MQDQKITPPFVDGVVDVTFERWVQTDTELLYGEWVALVTGRAKQIGPANRRIKIGW